jgi:hypothetical protein
MHTHTHACIHTHTHTHTHACKHTHTHAYTHITYTGTHTHTHRRNVTDIDLYDFELYANDTVEIVRPVAEEEDEVYLIFGRKGTDLDPLNEHESY